MMYYKTKTGIVACSNWHGRYFEMNNEFEEVVEIVVPVMRHPPKSKKPYGIVDKKELLEFLDLVIQEHRFLADRYEKLKKRWRLE